jgi:glycerophosphoryl diester phosphodiesterase
LEAVIDPLEAPDWLRDVPLAHRGLHDGDTPENSLPAFAAAAAAGYGVELDVYLSRDEVPVVAHDVSLSRVAGIDRRIGQLTAAELRDVRLEGGAAHVPTLAECLQVLRDVPVMVELKSNRPRAGRLEERTAEVLDDHPGPHCVASFNPVAVKWFLDNRPEVVRVLTATARNDGWLSAAVGRRLADLRDVGRVRPHGISYDLQSLPHPAPEAWRAAGGVLVTWTAVGDEGVARGRTVADNIIFEDARPAR